MKIKVCYAIKSLGYGGAEGQLLELIRGLDRSRFEPFLVLETEQNLERSDGLLTDVKVLLPNAKPIRGTLKRAYHAQLAVRRLCSHMQKIRPDILHAFLPAAVIYAGAGRLLKRVPPVVASRRSLVNCYRPNGRVEAAADFICTRAADFVLGNSQAVVEEVVRVDGVPRLRTQVIYNGVDIRRFSPAKRPGMRDQFGWDRHNLVVGMVANFLAYKRHRDFVSAAKLILASVPEARFLLVGLDLGEMTAVQQMITESGLHPYTRIVQGTRTPELAFATMDILLHTSETEGFSNVLLESMATGLPVIATNVGGNPEAVAEGVTGMLVPARAPEQIARFAMELAGNPERLRQWAENSRHRAEEVFSLEMMVRRHEDLYTRLVQRQATPTWKRLAGSA